MKISKFEEIEGWQIARGLVRDIYSITSQGAFSKDYGLLDQIRRAAGSSMHNIAEGFDGGSNTEFIRFLRYSQRSASEVQSQLYVAIDQNYIDQDTFDQIYTRARDLKSKVGGFINYLLKSER